MPTSTNAPSEIIDDKSELVVPFIINQLKRQPDGRVFFIGLNGLQGVGKTTLVKTLEQTLASPPYSLNVVVLSIDDLYLTRDDQVALAAANPQNKLVQHRGEPGTHDMELGQRVFQDLSEGSETLIPSYDKSQFNGAGDRSPAASWRRVNTSSDEKVQVVLFEGWCVGFQALTDEQVKDKYQASVRSHESKEGPVTTLWKHSLQDLLLVNTRLREYEKITSRLDAMVHIDALDTQFVYKWRLQQEAEMRSATGRGMSDEQVISFVDGYYPAYELYTVGLRTGVFKENGWQLRIVVNEQRRVVAHELV